MNVVKSGVILKSDLLTLKELELTDVTRKYIDWLNDSEINKYLETRFQYQDKYKVKEFVEKCRSSELDFLFGIFLSNTMEHIGNIKVGSINLHHCHAEIGLMIGDKRCWGRGYASNAISMVTEFCFENLRLSKISAGCYKSNVGSKKAFEKSGYKIEGILRAHVKLSNRRDDVYRLGCTKSDFIS